MTFSNLNNKVSTDELSWCCIFHMFVTTLAFSFSLHWNGHFISFSPIFTFAYLKLSHCQFHINVLLSHFFSFETLSLCTFVITLLLSSFFLLETVTSPEKNLCAVKKIKLFQRDGKEKGDKFSSGEGGGGGQEGFFNFFTTHSLHLSSYFLSYRASPVLAVPFLSSAVLRASSAAPGNLVVSESASWS